MGALVVMRYPTSLSADLADQTYVACGTGRKAWGCWGGKSGGTALRRSAGSTRRANAIAARNERAGIKCYLVNVRRQVAGDPAAARRYPRGAQAVMPSGARGRAARKTPALLDTREGQCFTD